MDKEQPWGMVSLLFQSTQLKATPKLQLYNFPAFYHKFLIFINHNILLKLE